MQNKFRLLLRGLWLLICAGTWIGTVFYRPTLGSVMVTFGAFFLLTSGFVLLSSSVLCVKCHNVNPPLFNVVE